MILWAVLSFMKGRTARFFVLMAALALVVSCSSNSLRSRTAGGVGMLPFAVLDERMRVLSHLHYEVEHCGDDVAELSFHFVRQHGDSLLWVECVEKVPLELLEIAEGNVVQCR